jgi:hypothetical protein
VSDAYFIACIVGFMVVAWILEERERLMLCFLGNIKRVIQCRVSFMLT